MTLRLNAYQQRVFDGQIPELTRLFEVLSHAPYTNPWHASAVRVANQLRDCCRDAVISRSPDDDDIMLCEQRCRHRICPRCGRDRARSLIATVKSAVHTLDAPAVLTLTLRASGRPLRDEIQRLIRGFAALRRHSAWRSHVAGGLYVIEATYPTSTEQWHPHVHAVIDTTYWPQSSIALAWREVTGDSSIVWIRRVRSVRQVARYVAGYVAKGSDVSALPDHVLPEYVTAIRSVRMVQTFGSLHGTRIVPVKPKPPAGMLKLLRAEVLAAHAAANVPGASDILRLVDAFRRPTATGEHEPVTGNLVHLANELIFRVRQHVARYGSSTRPKSLEPTPQARDDPYLAYAK